MTHLIILAAGLGSRLRPITLKKHKSLLNIGCNQTILSRLINQFKKKGIKKILVVTGHMSSQIEKYLKKNKIKFVYYKNFKDTNNLHTLWHINKHLVATDTIISFADLIFENKIIDLIITQKKNYLPIIDTTKVRKGTMGVEISKNYLKYIGRKNKKLANGNFIGMMKIKKEKIKQFKLALKSVLKNNEKKYYIEALNFLINKGEKINFLDIKKLNWLEVDTHEDYKKVLNRNFN